jgi:hypothetical protein
LSIFGQPCPILANFGQFWPTLSRTCRTGEALAPFSGGIWGSEVRKIHFHFGKMDLPAGVPLGVRGWHRRAPTGTDGHRRAPSAAWSAWSAWSAVSAWSFPLSLSLRSGFPCRPLLPGVAIALADRHTRPSVSAKFRAGAGAGADLRKSAPRITNGPRFARPGARLDCQRTNARRVFRRG